MNKLFQNKYRVKSRRLKGFDYASDNYYFITICVKDRKNLLGEIRDGEIFLSEMGKIVEEEWKKTPKIRENVKLDKFAILPNHFHAIVIIDNWGVNKDKQTKHVETHCNAFLQTKPNKNKFGPQRNNLSSIVRGFKSSTTKRIHAKGFLDFAWQSRFYDRIIRDEKEFNNIQGYILTNATNWEKDEENLENLA